MEIASDIVAKWKSQGKDFHLLDVRTGEEREMASLGGSHIPLDELEQRFGELTNDKLPWIVYCHHGVRSLYATQFLKFHGYDALSLRGGIDGWSITIDPTIPRY
jgi:rhodanese-related sulfurtransferase